MHQIRGKKYTSSGNHLSGIINETQKFVTVIQITEKSKQHSFSKCLMRQLCIGKLQ